MVVGIAGRYIIEIQNLTSRQRILVKQGAKGEVEFRQLPFKGGRTFEECFDGSIEVQVRKNSNFSRILHTFGAQKLGNV
jgi:hypothetical protein